MVIFQTSREGSALFSDVDPVPRAVEFKMATGCKFLSLAAGAISRPRSFDVLYIFSIKLRQSHLRILQTFQSG